MPYNTLEFHCELIALETYLHWEQWRNTFKGMTHTNLCYKSMLQINVTHHLQRNDTSTRRHALKYNMFYSNTSKTFYTPIEITSLGPDLFSATYHQSGSSASVPLLCHGNLCGGKVNMAARCPWSHQISHPQAWQSPSRLTGLAEIMCTLTCTYIYIYIFIYTSTYLCMHACARDMHTQWLVADQMWYPCPWKLASHNQLSTCLLHHAPHTHWQ